MALPRSYPRRGITDDVLARLEPVRRSYDYVDRKGKRPVRRTRQKIAGYRDPETGTVYSERFVRESRVGETLESRAIARKILATGFAGLKQNFEFALAGYLQREREEGRETTRARAIGPRSALWGHLKTLADAEAHPDKFKKGPRGKLAKALVALGRRPPGATYQVGDSPKALGSAFQLMRELLLAGERVPGAKPPHRPRSTNDKRRKQR